MKWTAGFLIVRVRPAGWRFGLVLPFPLFVIEEAMEAVASIVRLGLWFGWRPPSRIGRFVAAEAMADIVRLPAAFMRGLRANGPLVLAEVVDANVHLSVRIV